MFDAARCGWRLLNVTSLQAFFSSAHAICLDFQAPDSLSQQRKIMMNLSLIILCTTVYYCLASAQYLSYILCSENLHFERLLMSSIFVDMRIPVFKSTRPFKGFVAVFGILFVVTASLAALLTFVASQQRAAHVYQSSNCTLDLNPLSQSPSLAQTRNDVGQVLSSIVALVGGIYFLYCSLCEGALFGLAPRFSFQDRTRENMSKISKMKTISIQVLKRVCRAFVSGALLATRNPKNAYSAKQIAFFKRRLGSAAHVFACAQVVNEDLMLAIERDAYASQLFCGTHLELFWQRRFPLGR